MADAGPKWRGLATYAEAHGDHFNRIDAVIKDPSDAALLRIDLKDSSVRVALATANTRDAVLKIFRDHGGNYG